jgi:hypothetical protein
MDGIAGALSSSDECAHAVLIPNLDSPTPQLDLQWQRLGQERNCGSCEEDQRQTHLRFCPNAAHLELLLPKNVERRDDFQTAYCQVA